MGALQMTMEFKLGKQWVYNHDSSVVKYSRFNSVEDFNNQWEMIMVTYKSKFSRKQHELLNIMKGFAGSEEDAPGVCSARFKRLEDAYQKRYGVSISRDTWQKTQKKLEKYGIAIVCAGKRLIEGRGSTTANVIIFNRAEDVKAHEIAQKEAEEREIARLLEEEYARMTPVMNYAFNARKWAEQKAINEQEKELRAQREQAQQREIERQQKQAEKKSLYKKMREYAKNKNININEFMGIAYGSMNKMQKMVNVSQEQAEKIAFDLFVKALTAKPTLKRPQVNYAALYSWLLKDTLNMLTGQTKQMTKHEIAKKSGKKVGIITKGFAESETDPIRRAELLAAYEQQEKEKQEIFNDNTLLKAAQDHWTAVHDKQEKDRLDTLKRDMEQRGMSEKEYFEYKRQELLKQLNEK